MALTQFTPSNKLEQLHFTGTISKYEETVGNGNNSQTKLLGFIYELLDLASGYEIHLLLLENNARPLRAGLVDVDGLTVSIRRRFKRTADGQRSYSAPETVIYGTDIKNK